MASDHTPTPWSRNIPPISKYSVIFSGRNKHVFSFRISHLGQVDQAEIDCDFMLKAVNAYGPMMTALRDLIAVCERNIYPKPDAGPDHPWSVLQRARAILESSNGE